MSTLSVDVVSSESSLAWTRHSQSENFKSTLHVRIVMYIDLVRREYIILSFS